MTDESAPCYSDNHCAWFPGLLSDIQVRHLAVTHSMIGPFVSSTVREVPSPCDCDVAVGVPPQYHTVACGGRTMRKVVSYGLTSYGYDLRAAEEWRVFVPSHRNVVVDPKNFSPDAFMEATGEEVIIPPNSFVLARSVERFKMPPDVFGLVIGKSTYARCGVVVNTTPLQPGWQGYLTIEISNTTPLPSRVYANEGIASVLFFRGSTACGASYAGAFQNQPARIVLPNETTSS